MKKRKRINNERKIKVLAEQIFSSKYRNEELYVKWRDSQNAIDSSYEEMSNYLNGLEQEGQDVMSMFRPMVSDDIEVNQIVFGHNRWGWYCHTIQEVYNKNDDWKAYCADDGCRYGLYEAYIFKD